MIALDTIDRVEPRVQAKGPSVGLDRLVRVASHLVVWTLLFVPTIRSMARGWRPLADDASIAIGAWRSLSVHPPLVGAMTLATGPHLASDPGPLQYWILGPFPHLDPGQGVLIGSAILCAVILSVTIEILWRTAGAWAAVIFSLAIADLAITSPTPFLDPVWNSSFGFFWFIAFLGIAFVVGLGHLRYFPLLLFVGSVAVDSHLLYLPAVGCLLLATGICGWFTKRPTNRRWLWWTGIVAVLCWFAPIYQQLFGARPNLSLLLRSWGILPGGTGQTTEGWAFGLRALSRAVSLNPIWASPRPIEPFASLNDIANRNMFLGLFVIAVLVGVGILAWNHKKAALMSMCVVSLAGSLGVVVLFAYIPSSFFLSFIWVNLAPWLVGICIWLTLGLAVVTAIRSRARREETRISVEARRMGVFLGLVVACIAGTMVIVFPYGNQFVEDWAGVARVQRMTAAIEQHVPQGKVGMGIVYTGPNPYQTAGDEHGTAYLLLTDGWIPGMEPPINQLLGLPIDRKSPFVVFTERGGKLTAAHFYARYQVLWFLRQQ